MESGKNVDLSYRSLIREFKGNIRNFNRNQKISSPKRKYDNEGYEYYSLDKSGDISTSMDNEENNTDE